MKKNIVVLLIAVCLFITCFQVVSEEALIPNAACRRETGCTQEKFVDANGDGQYDNKGERCNFVDEDGDGQCDNKGECCNIVAANSNGMCGKMINNGCGARVQGCPMRSRQMCNR